MADDNMTVVAPLGTLDYHQYDRSAYEGGRRDRHAADRSRPCRLRRSNNNIQIRGIDGTVYLAETRYRALRPSTTVYLERRATRLRRPQFSSMSEACRTGRARRDDVRRAASETPGRGRSSGPPTQTASRRSRSRRRGQGRVQPYLFARRARSGDARASSTPS